MITVVRYCGVSIKPLALPAVQELTGLRERWDICQCDAVILSRREGKGVSELLGPQG